MDVFGDHLVSCKLNQLQKRHNLLRDALADCLRLHKISVQKEVAIGGMQRPVDLGLPSFDSRGPVAIDLVVHHTLSLSENRTSELAKTLVKGLNNIRSTIRKPYAMPMDGCLAQWGGTPGQEWDRMEQRSAQSWKRR